MSTGISQCLHLTAVWVPITIILKDRRCLRQYMKKNNDQRISGILEIVLVNYSVNVA